MTFRISRSHLEDFSDCQWESYLRYWKNGHGYVRKSNDLAMSTGSMVHRMLELFLGTFNNQKDYSPLLNNAIENAQIEYKREIEQRGLEIDESVEYEIERQCALAEGMVRVWVKYRFPKLMERFSVIEAEKEHFVKLGENIEFMFRPDALLRDKETGEITVLEFKTSSVSRKGIPDYLESFRYDSQTAALIWAAEKVTKDEVSSVRIEVLYKDSKRWNEKEQRTIYYSPLLRGFRLKTPVGFCYGIKIDKEIGSFVENSVELVKAKNWEAFDTFTEMPMKKWLDILPDEIAETQLFSTEIYRNFPEQLIWEKQSRSISHYISNSLQEENREDYFHLRLSRECYQNKYFKRCVYLPICYEGVKIDDDDRYIKREPHHRGEFDAS